MNTTASLEERIRSMEDRAEITDLTHRYCDLVWRRGGAAIANLFTEDGVFISGKNDLKGRDVIRDYYAGLQKRVGNEPHPYIHNHVITVNGDTAKATCYLDNRHGDCTSVSGGYYDDEFRRTAQGWKFASRRFHQVFALTFSVAAK